MALFTDETEETRVPGLGSPSGTPISGVPISGVPIRSRIARPIGQDDGTFFQRGIVNYQDAPQNTLVPAFIRSRDLMTLDPDASGEQTEKWGQKTGTFVGRDYIAGLTVFGRPMSHDQLLATPAGQELLQIAAKNRRGERRDFGEAITDLSWSDVPFVGIIATVGGSVSDAVSVHETFKKLQDGQPVTDDELIKTRLFLAKQERDSAGTWGASIADIVRQAPGFVTEFALTGGMASGARAVAAKGAVKGVEIVTARATSLAVGRGMKRLTKELAEEGIEKMARAKLGSALTASELRKGTAKFISEMTAAQKSKFADDLVTSITPLLKEDLKRTFGEKATYMYTDDVVSQMAKNLARAQVERTTAKLGASTAFSRFSKGLAEFTKDHLAAGLLDHGAFGTPTSTVLFGKHNKAGKALADALGILVVEAPVKGALQFGTSSLVRRAVMEAVNDGQYVSEAQLSLESQALLTGNRQLMDSAESIALGINFLEYVSENSGAGFASLFRSAGLATGLARQAERAFVGEVGGILAEAQKAEAGGYLRGLIRKAVGSVEETAQRTAEARVTSVHNFLRRNSFNVDRAFAARIAEGDVSHIADPVMRRFIGENAKGFVTRAIKDEVKQKGSDMTYRSFLRYWAADKMVKNHWGPDELINAFQRAGYDGIVEEMMEERYSDFAKGLFGWDEKGRAAFSSDALMQALRNITPGTDDLPWDQLAAEAVGFAIPMLTKAVSLRVMKSIGGPSVVGRVRDTAQAAQRAKEAMTSVEMSIDDFRKSHEATVGRLREEYDKAVQELAAVRRTAEEQGLSGEDATAAVAGAAERERSIAARIRAQEDAFGRILAANSIQDIAAEAADRLIFVPVVSTGVEEGDVKGDKLRVDRSSQQLANAYGARAAAVENAWMIGKAQFDAVDRNTDDPSLPWYRRWAQKAVGIAAAFATGDPSLAMRNYAQWAAVDEGLDPSLGAALLEQYRQDREDALAKMRAERTDSKFSEDEIWERMSGKYKASAAALMSSYLALHNVSMFAQSDFRTQAVEHLARAAGYTYRDGAYEKADRHGNVTRITTDDFARDNANKVDQMTADIAAATVRVLADRVNVDLGGGALASLFQMPADAPQRERTALAIAAKLAGSGNMFTSVRLGAGQTLEDAASVFGMAVPRDTLDRIREIAIKPDGTVDYDAPNEKDILEVAAALKRDVRTGSDAELAKLRRGIVDVARQLSAIDTSRTRTYTAPVTNLRDHRLYGKPYVDVTARKRSDGQWVVTLDAAATDQNRSGKVDLVRATLQELDEALSGFGYKRRDQGIVLTPTMVVATSDPVQLAQQLGIMRGYQDRVSAPKDGVVDPRYIHPALRKDENGDYVNKTQADVEAQLRAEMLRAWSYERFGEDVTRYAGETSADKTKARNEARIAHDALYGERGYMKILNDMLRERGVHTPIDGGVAGMFSSRSDYSVGLRHVRAVAGSVNQYVAVDFANGQSDSSAIMHAVLDDAYVRFRRLVAGGGRYAGVVGDFMKYLHHKAENLIYSDRVSKAERDALIRMRNDITSRYASPTRRTFAELAGAFALFSAEKDKADGTTASSPHSLAYQALSTSELYGDPQFLRFFALVDVMLGGSGFSYEIAARRLKADMPVKTGIARVMEAFGTNTEALGHMVNEIKPLGKTYNQFIEEVNRQARSLNPKAVPNAAAPAKPVSASGLIDFIRDVLASANFGSLADATKAFNTLAKTQDREFRRSFVRRASELAGLEQSLDAQRAEYVKRIKELTAQKQASDADREALAQKAADLQAKVDGLTVAINDLQDKLSRQASVKGGETSSEVPEPVQEATPLPGAADMESELELKARLLAGEDEDDELGDLANRLLLGNVDTTVGTSITFDNGNPVVAEHDSASADLPKEDCEFGAAAFRMMISALTGSTENLPFDDFRRYLDKVGTFREDEARRLYSFYKGQTARAEAMRARAEVDADDEGVHGSSDQNFNDKLLALYEGKELNALLTMGSFITPEEGRSLQGLLDSVKAVVLRQIQATQPGTRLYDSLARVHRLLNPRAVTEIHTKEYDELTAKIEELRRATNGADTPEIEKLRVQRAELFTNVDRESEWRRSVKELDAAGRDGRSVFDDVISDLMAGERPVAGRAAFLLSFLKALDPATRVRLLSLCANSAVCSRAEVNLETGRLVPKVGQRNSVSSRTVSAMFAPLRRMSAQEAEDALAKVKASLESATFETKAGSSVTQQTELLRRNLGAAADALAEVFGEENPLVCILRSDSMYRYLRTSKVFDGRGARGGKKAKSALTTIVERVVAKEGGLPEFAQQLVDALSAWAQQRKKLGAYATQEELDAAMDRVADAWLAYGADDKSALVGHKQAMNSTIWKRILESYAASRPVTVAPSVYIPGRSISTSSKVVVSAPGVVPVIAQWMDRPLSDKTSFAYIAKNFMMGPTGDRLRAMSDADFLEQVYPECRQNMTWPDAQRTPILAKNITRDFTPDYMYDRCAELFVRTFGDTSLKSDDEGYGRAVTGAATKLSKSGERSLTPVRWFSPIFSGEHTSGVLLQMPGLAYKTKDGNTGETSFTSFVKAGETFGDISTRLNEMVGLAKLGDDAKRAALTTAQVPAIALRGSKLVDGQVTYGEARVHVLVNFAPEMAPTKQEALYGSVVGVGYGMEEQRKAASDPMSSILKLHYMNTSGADLEMFKGLTSVASESSGTTTGLYPKGSPLRVMQDHLLKFRKSDADISTSIMTDRDGLKVCVLNSKVMGVPYVDAEGKAKRMKLLDYMQERLRDVEVPDGGFDKTVLDKLLGDGKTAPEGADANDYRPGTFDWIAPSQTGAPVTSRVTVSDLLGDGIKVMPVEGLSGKALDFSYVDNGLMSYTVANVSHVAEPETGKAARNTMVDAATMAAVQVRAGMALGGAEASARRVIDNFANWGLLAAALGADAQLVEDSRSGAGRSSKVEELIDGKGDDPHSLLVEDQLAYDVMKRVREGLNLPLHKIDCALSTGGAVYDDAAGKIVSHSADPFLRYAARGSVVFSKADRENKYNGISRSLGWGQINVHSDGFRYAWHLDRKAFAEAYGAQYADMASDRFRNVLDQVFSDLRSLDDRKAAALAAMNEARRAKSPELAARVADFERASGDVAVARMKLAGCFVDHYGQRVSGMKVQYEQAKRAEKSPALSRNYCDSVSFDDLFVANSRGGGRIFDRSAVHGGDKALCLDKDAATRAGAAHMAADADPVLLAGTSFGLPRTPSYNGSMWLQVLRASVPATTVEDEEGRVVGCGRDAVVIPDAQSLKILGCDHDGDKSACYMFSVNTVTGRAETSDVPDAQDVSAGEAGAAEVVLAGFGRQDVRRKYLDRMVAAGLASSPVSRVSEGKSLNVYRLAEGARERVSNAFVQGMFDLARNTVQESPDEMRDFYGTHLARATRAQPLQGSSDKPDTPWGRLIQVAGDAAKFLKGTTLANAEAGAHVSTSAMSADRARGQIVSFVGMLHIAHMSGKFDDVFSRGNAGGKVDAWFDFIYGLDGISNATFDDIKEQICRRLGWTQGMIDTVVTDLMFSQDKVPTTEEEFYTILADYVSSIANKGTRYYMMASSEPPEGNKSFRSVHVNARRFATGRQDKGVTVDTRVTMDQVLARFHMQMFRDEDGSTAFRLARDCRTDEGVLAIKDPMVRAVLAPVVAARAGLPAGAKAVGMEKRLCKALVRAMTKRGGESSGLGYVYCLAKKAGKDGVSSEEMDKFLRWFEGMETLAKMRTFVSAVNYTKADPGDPGKMGRYQMTDKAYADHMDEAPPGDLDGQLDVLHTAVSTIYGAGLMPVAGRGALAANNRGDALVHLAARYTHGHARDAVRKLIAMLAVSPAVPAFDTMQLMSNMLTDAFFVAALRTVPEARAGNAVFGSREYTWRMFDAIADAVVAVDEGIPRSMALRRGMEAMISTLYALVSTSRAGTDCPAFAYMSLNSDSSYGETLTRRGEEGDEDVLLARYPGAEGAGIRRLRPTYAMKDDAGLRRARQYLQQVLDGVFDTDGRFGKRLASYSDAMVKAPDYTLSLANLQAFVQESKPKTVTRETQMDRDLRLAQVIIGKMAAAVGVTPEKMVLQPSTILSQLIPVYATMTERFGSDNSVLELIPGVRPRLTAEQARMFSGALDGNAAPGFGFWDILAATAKAPWRRTNASSEMTTPVSSRLDEGMVSQVLGALDAAEPGRGNVALEDPVIEQVAKAVSGGEPTASAHEAPENRVMLDVLGPNETFRRVHDFVDDVLLNTQTDADVVPVPTDSTVTEPDPQRANDAEKLVPAIVAALGHWADVEHVKGTSVIKIKARGGLRGSGAQRFAGGGRADMVITVRLGTDSRSGSAVDVNSPNVAASFCEAAKKLGITPEQFLHSLSHAERTMLVQALTRGTGAQQEGNAFSLSLPSWAMTGKDIATLAGEIHLGNNASAGTFYHELFHTMLGMFRMMDVFSEEDVETFRKRYGAAPKGTGWLFNEEKAAEEFRRYAEKRAKGQTTTVKDEADQKAHSVFAKLWEALKSFLNALVNGFSHSDPESTGYLFDMVLTGTAAMSEEKMQSLGVDRLADNEVFSGEFHRLLERGREDKGAFVPLYGADAKTVEADAEGRVAKALEGQYDDPFSGFIDQATSTAKVKVPRSSAKGRLAQAERWSKALRAELQRPAPRMSAVAKLLQGLVAVREGVAGSSEEVDIPVDFEAEAVSWRTVANMDNGLSPETRAGIYTPEESMGRAAARRLVGQVSDADLKIIAGTSAGKTFTEQLAANTRYVNAAKRNSRWAEEFRLGKERADAVAKLGVKHFLRAEGRDVKSKKQDAKNHDAYMLLVAAAPYIKSRVFAANRQKGDVVTPDGAVTRRSEKRLTAENYAGFLMATGWRDAGYYVEQARERLADLRQKALDTLDGQPSRISRVAEHLIENLTRFDTLDSSSLVTDPQRWDAEFNAFMREVMTGIKRGEFDMNTLEEGQYSNAEATDAAPDGATVELRERNQKLYGFGEVGSSDDAVVSQMIRDAVTTMLAIRASARFARELGTVPGPTVDMPAAVNNPSPVELQTLAEQFRLSTGNIVEGDEDLIEKHCQPAYVAANLDSWYAASMPNMVGTLPLRTLFMDASAKLRGSISAQTNVENFLANYMGVSRTEGNKLLRIVEKIGKFEMSGGFYHRVEKGKEQKYIGFDNYHGLAGQTTGVRLTEDEYRTIDLFLKSLAVRANGGSKFITGASGIQFSLPMATLGRYTKERAVRELERMDAEDANARRPQKQMSRVKFALARLALQLHAEVLDDSGMGFFKRAVDAANSGIEVANALNEDRLNSTGVEMSEAEYNNAVLAEMERKGVVVCEYGEDGLRVSGAFAIDVGEIESAFRDSTAFGKLVDAGRDKEFMRGDNLINLYMKGYHELRREVAKQPWLTSGDARFLNNFATPLPFYQGTGNFMYHANRVLRDRQVSAVVRLAKHEATFLSMCRSEKNQAKSAVDLSPAELNMLHDYFNTEESGEELLRAIVDGKYAKGSAKALSTGLVLSADTPYLDAARQIYLKQQERNLLMAEGRTLDELDDDASIRRMIQAYEGMMEANGATLTAATGISDERMFQLHGVLPMNMQIGHKIHTAMNGISDSLFKRSCLVNMMFTKTLEGNPVYYINPSRYGVEAGGIPDEVWGAMAKWWASRNPDALKYDPKLSGLENARALYGVVSSRLQDASGKMNGRAYESMKQEDLFGQRSVENIICVKDDPADSDTSRLNVMGGVGEALGYAKHLFMTDRVPGGARLQWLDKMMSWSKSLSVMGSAFFPIATKWESATAAVGALATLGSNLSPEFIRRHPGAVNALTKAFGGGWVTGDFIGFRDIIDMMDSNDPFLADIVRWAEALGITMSNTVNNPMEPSKGYVAKDIANIKNRLRDSGFSAEAASRIGGILETMFLRQGEKAFTYALNATKLAVTCQIAMKLRHQAELEGRAFDPIRDLAKYSAYIDTEIGGIDPLRYAWAHPQMQRIMNRTMFSWQWTRSAWEAGGGHMFEDLLFGGHTINKETRKYIVGRWLRMYGMIMIGVPMMAQMLIKALAVACGRNDDDDKLFTWENEEKTRWSAFDLTPLMKVVHAHELTARVIAGGLGALYGRSRAGGLGLVAGAVIGAAGVPNYTGEDAANSTTRGRRYYMHFGKQGWEFLRWFDDPVSQFMAKLSMPTQRLLEGLFGRNLAYLDRELPFADKGFAERWMSLGMDSAPVNFAKAFVPFTVNSITTFGDAGVASYFGPVQMGASQTNIVDRYVKALKAWADNDRTAYAYGQSASKRRVKYVRSQILADITREARANGIQDPEELIDRAIGQLTPRYYGKLMQLLPENPEDPVDAKEIAKVCRALMRLGATYRGAKDSLEKRLKARGTKLRDLTPEQRGAILDALRSGFSKPFDY